MSTPPKDELIFVEKLLREGKLEDALQLARDLEGVANLDINDKMEAKSLQLEILSMQNDHERVLKLADIVINLSIELKLPYHKLDGLIFKAISLVKLKKFKERDEVIKQLEVFLEQVRKDEDTQFVKREIHFHMLKGEIFLDEYEFEKSLDAFNKSLLVNEKLNNMYQNAVIIKSIADVYFYYGHLDISMQNYETSLSIAEELGYRRIIAFVYHMMAGLRFKEDKLKVALEFEEKSGDIFKELNDEYNLAFNSQYLGFLYKGLGKSDQSLEHLINAKNYFEQIGHKARVINVLINIIGLYKTKGDYDKALSTLDIYYKMNEEMGDEHCLGIAHMWYGSIYCDKGELDEALKHYQQSLEIFHKFKTLDTLGALYYNLGDLYLKKDELDKSLDYHLLALEFREKMQMGDKLSKIAISLKSLVVLHLVLEENDSAYDYLARLEILSSETDNVEIEHLYLLAKSIYLKNQREIGAASDSKKILLDLINKQNIDYSVSVEAILNLCELLLIELGTTEDMSLLIETKGLIAQLTEIASYQNLYPLLAEAYLLQAQIALIEIKIDEAKYFISNAQQLAEERGLRRLAIIISNEYDLILDKLDQWDDFTRKLPTIAEKLELTHIEKMLSQLIKKRMIDTSYAVKEEEYPAMLFILNTLGTILFTENFDEQLDDQDLEQFLEVLREIKPEECSTSIQRNRFQEFTYLTKNINSFLFSYVFVGKAYSSINKMNAFIDEIKDPSPIWDILKSCEDTGQPISVLNRMAISQTINDVFKRKNNI
ncbi:MAG: tetratricopeptide repeat protein [Candidatus Heimdallarchaeota archaeon]|nr:tetratricopeptide repeat protein [Candidatus Heimdallarchaeota archaeon]